MTIADTLAEIRVRAEEYHICDEGGHEGTPCVWCEPDPVWKPMLNVVRVESQHHAMCVKGDCCLRGSLFGKCDGTGGRWECVNWKRVEVPQGGE